MALSSEHMQTMVCMRSYGYFEALCFPCPIAQDYAFRRNGGGNGADVFAVGSRCQRLAICSITACRS